MRLSEDDPICGPKYIETLKKNNVSSSIGLFLFLIPENEDNIFL
jgi:hypothetical protein